MEYLAQDRVRFHAALDCVVLDILHALQQDKGMVSTQAERALMMDPAGGNDSGDLATFAVAVITAVLAVGLVIGWLIFG